LPGRIHAHLLGQACARLCEQADELKAAGVDEIWCVSVNDAFVMGAWARDQKTGGKVRMLADGSADFAKATGLTLDLTRRAWACAATATPCWSRTARSPRSTSKAPGKFEVSDAATLLAQAKA
jgi:peroxiredoxin